MEILPAILAHSEEEFARKVERVHSFGLTLHIDVMDGRFVGNTTWAPPERMRDLLGGMLFEAHLMVDHPETAIPEWLAAGATRVFFHAETADDTGSLLGQTNASRARMGIVLNPETTVRRIAPSLPALANILVMGVSPGWSGQQFDERAMEKIGALRAAAPGLRIAVDGGVTPKIVRRLKEAGADAIIAASALTDAPDPAAALAAFMAAMQA